MLSAAARTRALVLVCLFGVGMSTNYTSHGPLLGVIADEFGLTSADAGAIATAFFLGSGSTMLFGGTVADRFGARRVVTVGFLVTTLGNFGIALAAPTFELLLAWRAFAGLGSGIAFAAGAAYTTRVFARHAVHLAQGLYGAAFMLGSGSTLILMPALAGPAQDWRLAYLLLGVGTLLGWLAWATLAPPDPSTRHRAGPSLRSAMRVRNTWLLALCHTCGFGLAMVVGTWATAYLEGTFALPLTQAGALGSIWLITGIAGRSGGGAILERGIRPVLMIRGSLVVAALGLGLMALPERPLAVAVLGLLVTGLGTGLPYAAVFNGAAASAPHSAASAQSLVGWGGALVAIVGPPVVGGLLDLTGSYSAGLAVLGAFALVVLGTTAALQPFSFRAARASSP